MSNVILNLNIFEIRRVLRPLPMKQENLIEATEFLKSFDNPTLYKTSDQIENIENIFYDQQSQCDSLKRLLDEIPRFPSKSLQQEKQRRCTELQKELLVKEESKDSLRESLQTEIEAVVDMIEKLRHLLSRIQEKSAKLDAVRRSLDEKLQEAQSSFDKRITEQQQFQENILERRKVLDGLENKETEIKELLDKLQSELKLKEQEIASYEESKLSLKIKIEEQQAYLIDRDSKIDEVYQEQFTKTNFLKEIFNESDMKTQVKLKRKTLFKEFEQLG
eukprot:NODE_116_length_18347_cov_2.280962.p10 type:complete len:276 gc:universal NODE_116_length_18347_cov_2.280962:8319-9146(+)